MLLGRCSTESRTYTYGAITRSGTAFQLTSASHTISNSAHPWQQMYETLPQPQPCNPCQVSHRTGLAYSDFARHYSRNHYCFLFLWVLRCFTSPRSLHTPYFIQVQVTGHNSSWVTPFGNPRINARLPTPQGISQAPTSFIGSRCQGIHHAPLPTCHTNHQHTPTNKHTQTVRPLADVHRWFDARYKI